jgi:hypothetical protein
MSEDTAHPDILEALQKGEVTLQGQFLNGSNYTYLANLECGALQFKVVYKPMRGEQPLWDFPAGSLAKREVAAYAVSEALGWRLVPPTILRRKGLPLGPGSVQQYIEHDPEYHYFHFNDEDRQRLRPVVLFDLLINNADRKGGHVLTDNNGRLWLIDHGICFHSEQKLRTVIWDFAGEEIPPQLLTDLQRFAEQLEGQQAAYEELSKLLQPAELAALRHRARYLVEKKRFPQPASSRRPYPWPPV